MGCVMAPQQEHVRLETTLAHVNSDASIMSEEEAKALKSKLASLEKNLEATQKAISKLQSHVEEQNKSILSLENKYALMQEEKIKNENEVLTSTNEDNYDNDTIHEEQMPAIQQHVSSDDLKSDALNPQLDPEPEVKTTSSHNPKICSIGELFSTYHFNVKDDTEYMNKDNLMKCLSYLGVNTVNDKTKDIIWELFDLDKANEITLSDFQATLSAFVSGNDQDTLLALFQIFDHDNDGYLNVDDLSSLLFAQNHIALLITQRKNITALTKADTLKRAEMMMLSNGSRDKISFAQFKLMLGDRKVSKLISPNFDYKQK